MPKLELLPAVDVEGGEAVRLVQGEAGTATGYGEPLAAALAWQRAGAEWVHLVDLDAAFGRGGNRELLADVVARLEVGVELSGGIRDDESLRAALATGCARVNLGTAAMEQPAWVAKVIAELREPRTTMGGVNLVAGYRPELWRELVPDDAPASVDKKDSMSTTMPETWTTERIAADFRLL